MRCVIDGHVVLTKDWQGNNVRDGDVTGINGTDSNHHNTDLGRHSQDSRAAGSQYYIYMCVYICMYIYIYV
jgi:hypothetical protein